MPTTTERGLGWQHQKQRARLLRALVDGTPCAHCGQPMYHTQALQADHTVPRSLGGKVADRLLHAWCNMSRGNGTRTPSADRDDWRAGGTSRDWSNRDDATDAAAPAAVADRARPARARRRPPI